MKLLVLLLFVAVSEIQSGPLFHTTESPKSSTPLTHSSQNVPKRYVLKEVILYLTPSEIEKLKTGSGLITLEPHHHLKSKYGDKLALQTNKETTKKANLQIVKPIEELPAENLPTLNEQTPLPLYPINWEPQYINEQQKEAGNQNLRWIPYDELKHNQEEALKQQSNNGFTPILKNPVHPELLLNDNVYNKQPLLFLQNSPIHNLGDEVRIEDVYRLNPHLSQLDFGKLTRIHQALASQSKLDIKKIITENIEHSTPLHPHRLLSLNSQPEEALNGNPNLLHLIRTIPLQQTTEKPSLNKPFHF